MYFQNLLPLIAILLTSCHQPGSLNETSNHEQATDSSGKNNPFAIVEAIPLPAGYKRLPADSNSFAAWLRKRDLKKDKTVYLFNGDEKGNQRAQFAVLNIPVGKKDLQQCADAVMRLRAEYLFAAKKYADIIFYDNEEGAYPFAEPYTSDHLYAYLEKVFGRCGSASLSKQLHKKKVEDIEPGDVFIRGGFPGHAEIVIDVAVNAAGKKIFMLAQSYMPAQDIHILVNPRDEKLSPWYEIEEDVITPEYVFDTGNLKTW